MFNLKRIATVAALAMAAAVPTAGTASASTPPQITPIKPFVAKWILPPRTSSVYGYEKWFAESMGYETVEHDDFSYPGPRP